MDDDYYGSRIKEIVLPGVHSDIGSGYGEGIEELSLSLASQWLSAQGVPLNADPLDARAVINMGENDSDWFLTPISNVIKGLIYGKSRTTISLPPTIEDLNASPLLYIEYAARKVYSVTRQLNVVDNHERIDKVASVQLQFVNNYLTVKTNCPNNISFEKESRMLLFNNQLFEKITDEILDLANPYGMVQMYYAENPDNYTVKQ